MAVGLFKTDANMPDLVSNRRCPRNHLCVSDRAPLKVRVVNT